MGQLVPYPYLSYVLTAMGRTGFPIMLPAAVLLIAAACGKGPDQAPDRVSVSFEALPPAISKSLSSEAEDRVETLDLLVFRADDGLLDAHARSSSSLRVGSAVTAGIRLRWYVIANAPAAALDGYANEAEFLDGETFLGESASLAMHASGQGIFSAGENRSIQGILLHRYACKVSVTELNVRWLGAFSQSPPCTLDEVALVNVRGSCPWSGTPTAEAGDLWYNPSRIDLQDASIQELLVWEGPLIIPGPDPVPLHIPLYALPNPSSGEETGGGGPWSPRKTRLCLRLTIDGIQNWYSADLPPMDGNRHYVVTRLVIDGPGSAHPDEELVRTQISYNLQVQDWEDSWNDLSFE